MNNRGFTLIELLLTLGIFLMFIVAIGDMIVKGLQYRAVIWEQLYTQNEGRKIVQDFVNELRTANYSSIGAYPIEKAAAQEIVFYSNIDSDSWRERIHYYLSGTILKKGITKPSGTPLTYNTSTEKITEVAHDVVSGTSSIFYYYDDNYTGDASSTALSLPVNVANVRLIRIKLLLEANPNMAPKPLEVEALGGIRNLKTN